MVLLSTSGWGVDSTASGQGTTAADVRKVWGALYRPGIISGATITRNSSSLTYTVSAGVVAIQISTGEVVMAPIEAADVAAPAVPSSGNSTVLVYARQRDPNNEDAKVEIKSTTGSLPDRSVALGRFIASAGQTNAAQSIPTGGIDYSIPYGASLGILHQHRLMDNITFGLREEFGVGTFNLPTDRTLKVSILTCLSAFGATGFGTTETYCEASYDVYLDGVKKWRWNSPGLGQAWGHYYWADNLVVPAGQHTMSYVRYRSTGPGNPYHHYLAGEMPGTLFTVKDDGPVV